MTTKPFQMPHGASLFESLSNFRALIDKIKARGWIRKDEAVVMTNHCRANPAFARKLTPVEFRALDAATHEAGDKIPFMVRKKSTQNAHVTSDKPSVGSQKPGAGSDSMRQFHNLVAQIQRKRSVTPDEAERVLAAIQKHRELAQHLSRDDIARLNDAARNAETVRF